MNDLELVLSLMIAGCTVFVAFIVYLVMSTE